MGGKGQRRREKNYRAAHGGSNRLPPPPDPKKMDALPSKLRKLMSFTTSLSQGSPLSANNSKAGRTIGDGASKSEFRPEGELALALKTAGVEDPIPTLSQTKDDQENEDVKSRTDEEKKKKKKRKRNKVEDLHFAETMEKMLGNSSKRREHKKKYLEANKNKRKKATTKTENEDFARDKVEFGDVVQAPPKLLQVPKASKKHTASQERIRLKAVDEYRKRRGWTSRPGIQLPTIM